MNYSDCLFTHLRLGWKIGCVLWHTPLTIFLSFSHRMRTDSLDLPRKFAAQVRGFMRRDLQERAAVRTLSCIYNIVLASLFLVFFFFPLPLFLPSYSCFFLFLTRQLSWKGSNMCETMGSKNQVDYVGTVFARITYFILHHLEVPSLISCVFLSPLRMIFDWTYEFILSPIEYLKQKESEKYQVI